MNQPHPNAMAESYLYVPQGGVLRIPLQENDQGKRPAATEVFESLNKKKTKRNKNCATFSIQGVLHIYQSCTHMFDSASLFNFVLKGNNDVVVKSKALKPDPWGSNLDFSTHQLYDLWVEILLHGVVKVRRKKIYIWHLEQCLSLKKVLCKYQVYYYLSYLIMNRDTRITSHMKKVSNMLVKNQNSQIKNSKETMQVREENVSRNNNVLQEVKLYYIHEIRNFKKEHYKH